MKADMLSVHKIWKDKQVTWIKTYKTLLKYISTDYSDIFKPTVIGTKTGKRYFVKRENLEKFIDMFKNNKLQR